MNKINYFYKAKFKRIPCYFQPETNELYGRNAFYDFILQLVIFIVSSSDKFKILIEHDTVTRNFLKKRNLIH
jgi:hypothetical protein